MKIGKLSTNASPGAQNRIIYKKPTWFGFHNVTYLLKIELPRECDIFFFRQILQFWQQISWTSQTDQRTWQKRHKLPNHSDSKRNQQQCVKARLNYTLQRNCLFTNLTSHCEKVIFTKLLSQATVSSCKQGPLYLPIFVLTIPGPNPGAARLEQAFKNHSVFKHRSSPNHEDCVIFALWQEQIFNLEVWMESECIKWSRGIVALKCWKARSDSGHTCPIRQRLHGDECPVYSSYAVNDWRVRSRKMIFLCCLNTTIVWRLVGRQTNLSSSAWKSTWVLQTSYRARIHEHFSIPE